MVFVPAFCVRFDTTIVLQPAFFHMAILFGLCHLREFKTQEKGGKQIHSRQIFSLSLKPISISVTRIGLRAICLQKDRLHIIVLVLLAALRVMRIARS